MLHIKYNVKIHTKSTQKFIQIYFYTYISEERFVFLSYIEIKLQLLGRL